MLSRTSASSIGMSRTKDEVRLEMDPYQMNKVLVFHGLQHTDSFETHIGLM